MRFALSVFAFTSIFSTLRAQDNHHIKFPPSYEACVSDSDCSLYSHACLCHWTVSLNKKFDKEIRSIIDSYAYRDGVKSCEACSLEKDGLWPRAFCQSSVCVVKHGKKAQLK